MSDLSPEDRALLDSAREGHEPTDSDRRRVRALLVAQLGVGAGLISSSTGASAGVGGTVATGSTVLVVGKALAALAVVATLAGGGVAGYRAAFPPHARAGLRSGSALSAVATKVAPETPLPGAPRTSIDVGAAAPEEQSPPLTDPVATSGQVPGVRTTAAVARAATVPPPVALRPDPASEEPALARQPTPTTLEAETSLVSRAISALHAGDPGAALRFLDEHRQRFPDGVLSEERDTERVAALCALGRTSEGRAAAEVFLAAHPAGALAARVRSACVAPAGAIP